MFWTLRAALAAITVFTVIAVTTHFMADGADSRNQQNGPSEAVATVEPQESFRIREGDEWEDSVGEFQLAGERVRFHLTDRDVKVTVLENLALERVSRVLEQSRTLPQWRVSGTITEFHGGNFLLIRRAVVKARLP